MVCGGLSKLNACKLLLHLVLTVGSGEGFARSLIHKYKTKHSDENFVSDFWVERRCLVFATGTELLNQAARNRRGGAALGVLEDVMKKNREAVQLPVSKYWSV